MSKERHSHAEKAGHGPSHDDFPAIRPISDANGITDPPLLPPGDLLDTLGGCRILEVEPQAGRIRAAFTARPQFCHTNGTIVQGGFVTAWLDFAMAYATMIHSHGRKTLASLEIKVSFLKRVGPGPITVEGRVLRLGGKVAFVEASLWNAAGDLAATATSTALVIPNTVPASGVQSPQGGTPAA